MRTEPRILVVGAGPAGCTLALLLATRGTAVTLLEADPTLPLDLRASTFHPPTLDLLESLGLTRALLAQGLIAPEYQYRDRRTGKRAVFDLGVLEGDTRHPYRLQCEQFKLTQTVVRRLRSMPNVHLLFGHRVVAVSQDADGASLRAVGPAGEITVAGAYVVGTDGAGSVVRKEAGIAYEGFTYPEKFLVVSTAHDFRGNFPGLSAVNYLADPEQWCVLLRTTLLWRVLFPTRPEQHDEELLSDAYLQRELCALTGEATEFKIGHRTLYRIHQRVAETFRRGRVLLAGDAAHVNNPLGGMGMNGGVHDAFNLGEKLARVLTGESADAQLDLYDLQRRTIARRFVQEQTMRNKQSLEERDAESQARRLAELQAIAADPVRARQFLRRTSMIDSLREAEEIRL